MVRSRVYELVEGILKGDRACLARAITLVESRLPDHSREAQDLLKELEASKTKPLRNTMRIGISGSPGVGKSSLIERLGMYCIEQEGLKAIDPSSQVSGGSILGDKTRMSRLANDPRAFVRPSPSGGLLGGVARGTFFSIKLCELAGYDVVFVESVGVGQSEIQLSNLTDIFVLCCAPRAGDDLQAMKRGISEAADLILLNKAEEPMGEEARRAVMELKMSQALRSHPAQVIPVSALNGTGMKEAWAAIKHIQSSNTKLGERRKEQETKWTKSFIESELIDRFEKYMDSKDPTSLQSADLLKLSDELIRNFCRQHQ